MTGKRGKAHHGGSYGRRAALVRGAANANPDTRCWRCGGTKAEGVRQWGDQGGRWTAGHVQDGQVNGELRPEHAHCNSVAGAHYGNTVHEPRSRAW